MPDPTSRIRFDSVLLKKARVILRTTGPDSIWMAWSGCGQTHLVLKQACVQKSSGLVLSERDRPATSFPLSHSAAFFHNRPGSYCATSAPDTIWFWLSVRFGSNGSSPEASRYARITRSVSGHRFRANPDRTRIGLGLFTGIVQFVWQRE